MTEELAAALRALVRSVRAPDPDAHPHAAAIAVWLEDFQAAVAAACARPAALRATARLLGGAARLEFDRSRDPDLTRAWDHLAALPAAGDDHRDAGLLRAAREAHAYLLAALSTTPR